MLAVACFFFEEALTHKPLILGKISQYLFNPLYEFPEIQAWFDSLFGGGTSPVFVEPDGPVNFIDALKQVLEEEADRALEEQLSSGSADAVKDQAFESYSMKFNR